MILGLLFEDRNMFDDTFEAERSGWVELDIGFQQFQHFPWF
jgi:hypothetical protein